VCTADNVFTHISKYQLCVCMCVGMCVCVCTAFVRVLILLWGGDHDGHGGPKLCVCMRVFVCMYVCVCACVCVCRAFECILIYPIPLLGGGDTKTAKLAKLAMGWPRLVGSLKS